MEIILKEELEDKEMIKLCERLTRSFEQFNKAIFFESKIKLIFVNNRTLSPSYCKKDEVIVVNKGFMTLVTLHLLEDSKNKDSLIFKDMDNDKYVETFLIIREFMLEFMILHELFHIKHKHFQILQKLDCSEIRNNLEYDADLDAIKFIFSKYSLLIEKYGIEKYDYLIEKYFYSILYLFNIIYLNNIISNFHDLSNMRVVFLLAKMVDLKREYPNLFHMTIHKLENIKEKCIYEFIPNNKNFFNVNVISEDKIALSLFSFFNFLKEK